MIKYLFELSAASDVYYMGESYIGHLFLEQAAEIGYYQGEPGYGAPPRFMLLAEK